MRDVLQQRIIRFLLEQSRKDPEKYGKFFEDYGLFMREGIVTSNEQDVKVGGWGGRPFRFDQVLMRVWRRSYEGRD